MKVIKRIGAALAALSIIVINLSMDAYATEEDDSNSESLISNESENKSNLQDNIDHEIPDFSLSVKFDFDDGENGYYISHPRTAHIEVNGNNIDYDSLVVCINDELIKFDEAESYSSYSSLSTYSYTAYSTYSSTTYTYTDENGNTTTEIVEEENEYTVDGDNNIIDDGNGENTEIVVEYSEENVTCEYSIDFDNDGLYSGYVSVKDTYGRETRVDIDEFCIDTTAPEISVIIDDEEYLYTNQPRIAHIKIYDANLDGCGEYEYVFEEGEDNVELSVADKAGNVSQYESETYIQDYTLPTVYVSGIENDAHYNSNVIMDIVFEDANIDIDNTRVTLKGKAGDEFEIYGVLEEDGRYAMLVEDKNGFSDDYYELSFEACDIAGNVISDTYSFTINRRGGLFKIADRIRELFNTFSDNVTGIKVEENNLSPIDKSSVNIILTKNGRVVDIDYDEDVTIDEVKEENGYRITYSFNDDLFTDNAVYTISITDTDIAGNNNDTRFQDDTNDITFGVNHTVVLGAQATRTLEDMYNITTNHSKTPANEEVVTGKDSHTSTTNKVVNITKIVLATMILILLVIYLVLKIRKNKRK